MSHLAALAVISGAIGLSGPARAAVDGRDQTIVGELRLTNDHGLALAELGTRRANAESVRALAEVMAEDHRAADMDLLAYAGLRGMNLSYVGRPGADRPLHGPLALEDLAAAPAARFDYDYVARVITDQQAAIDELASARRIAHDPQLGVLMDAAMPTLQAHLARARALLASIPEPSPAPVRAATVPAPMAPPPPVAPNVAPPIAPPETPPTR